MANSQAFNQGQESNPAQASNQSQTPSKRRFWFRRSKATTSSAQGDATLTGKTDQAPALEQEVTDYDGLVKNMPHSTNSSSTKSNSRDSSFDNGYDCGCDNNFDRGYDNSFDNGYNHSDDHHYDSQPSFGCKEGDSQGQNADATFAPRPFPYKTSVRSQGQSRSQSQMRYQPAWQEQEQAQNTAYQTEANLKQEQGQRQGQTQYHGYPPKNSNAAHDSSHAYANANGSTRNSTGYNRSGYNSNNSNSSNSNSSNSSTNNRCNGGNSNRANNYNLTVKSNEANNNESANCNDSQSTNNAESFSSRFMPDRKNIKHLVGMQRHNLIITALRRNIIYLSLSLCCMALVFITIGALIYKSTQSSLVPYVVTVDSHGVVLNQGIAEPLHDIPKTLVTAQLCNFIRNVRMLTQDQEVQQQAILNAYAFVQPGSQVTKQLNEYYSTHNPFSSPRPEPVAINIANAIETGENTFQIDWVESRKDAEPKRMRGLISYSVQPHQDDSADTLLRNPLGLFVENFVVSQIIS